MKSRYGKFNEKIIRTFNRGDAVKIIHGECDGVTYASDAVYYLIGYVGEKVPFNFDIMGMPVNRSIPALVKRVTKESGTAVELETGTTIQIGDYSCVPAKIGEETKYYDKKLLGLLAKESYDYRTDGAALYVFPTGNNMPCMILAPLYIKK